MILSTRKKEREGEKKIKPRFIVLGRLKVDIFELNDF